MGAETFEFEAKGMNAREVYNELVEDALREYGQDPYNGTISTTSGFVELTLPEKYKNNPSAYADELLMSNNPYGIGKWDNAGMLLLSQDDTIDHVAYATTEDRNPVNGTRKWKTQYGVYGSDMRGERVLHGYYDKQTEAEKAAKSLAVEFDMPVEVRIEKILTNAPNAVATFYPKHKKVKVKNGMKTWLVFGWGAS